ncbi:GNAT family N-acetyltransferase [Allopontixanthobacter sp.]|uniref:GNAT family N-acetyltransferase n=1 Tax=Allopontixanthobacter sp. TaxID=2906452 RepID=UPI002ABC61E5|nr:GNAT family N-acetyltransferase [Allopontixanthobacter sp.]MDZ4307097.1 GNAT family N-acetyltransferase [Allopontixanthobacter sp.]
MDVQDVEITRHPSGSSGEYRAHVTSSKAVGRLTWVTRGDGARIAEHTLVPREIGGRGIAGLLVQAMVADAREQGFRIVPQCSYVAAKFDDHPEWADLLA